MNLNFSSTDKDLVHIFLSFLHIVLQVALVPKGDPNNFTFSGEGDAEKLAKITLPSYLFQNQGEIAERNQSSKVGPMFFKVSTLKEYNTSNFTWSKKVNSNVRDS